MLFKTLKPRQSDHYFADNISERIIDKENVSITIKMSVKFVPWSPIDAELVVVAF